MDGIRPVLRVGVVFLSLGLMIAYVIFYGQRAAPPATGGSVGTPATTPAVLSGEAAAPLTLSPGMLIYSSKSAPVFPADAPAVVAPAPVPTTKPTMIFSTSKSMILTPPELAPVLPATRPAGN